MALTRGVTERRARRLARAKGPVDPTLQPGGSSTLVPSGGIPHDPVTDDPTSPQATADMAAGGLPVNRGNSNHDPLTPQGHQTASKVGAELAALGGPDQIIPSSATRTQQTAQDVAAQTGAPVSPPIPGLESHSLGNLEGSPKTPATRRMVGDLMKKSPNVRIPGQGAMSSHPGESFNDFRVRGLGAVRGLMQRLASEPTARIVVPTSTQVVKLVRAWCAAGCPDDGSVDHRPMLAEDKGAPGDMERFFPEPLREMGADSVRPG